MRSRILLFVLLASVSTNAWCQNKPKLKPPPHKVVKKQALPDLILNQFESTNTADKTMVSLVLTNRSAKAYKNIQVKYTLYDPDKWDIDASSTQNALSILYIGSKSVPAVGPKQSIPIKIEIELRFGHREGGLMFGINRVSGEMNGTTKNFDYSYMVPYQIIDVLGS